MIQKAASKHLLRPDSVSPYYLAKAAATAEEITDTRMRIAAEHKEKDPIRYGWYGWEVASLYAEDKYGDSHLLG